MPISSPSLSESGLQLFSHSLTPNGQSLPLHISLSPLSSFSLPHPSLIAHRLFCLPLSRSLQISLSISFPLAILDNTALWPIPVSLCPRSPSSPMPFLAPSVPICRCNMTAAVAVRTQPAGPGTAFNACAANRRLRGLLCQFWGSELGPSCTRGLASPDG